MCYFIEIICNKSELFGIYVSRNPNIIPRDRINSKWVFDPVLMKKYS
jgi:hypothetical protein